MWALAERRTDDTEYVNDQKRNYEPSAGIIYGAVGAVLIALGSMSLANANESAAFGILGVVLLASGFYVTVAGAVARGIQLARG